MEELIEDYLLNEGFKVFDNHIQAYVMISSIYALRL
jgi:hypothetical protein